MKIALWSTRFFKFIYFTPHSHVTGAESQSNCFISGMCGPPGFHFSTNGAKKCSPPGFPLIQKTGWTTHFFHALSARSAAVYGHFQADAVTSESFTRIPSSHRLYS